MTPDMEEKYAWFTLIKDKEGWEKWSAHNSSDDTMPDTFPCYVMTGADGSETWHNTFLYADTLCLMLADLEKAEAKQ